MIEIPIDKKLVLFDGVCNLCNRSVQFIIRNDRNNTFLYAPLQGKTGKEVVSKFNIDITKTDSIILYSREGELSVKSSAVLKISKHLRFPINIMIIFMIIPNFIRNWFYDFVARNRYKWFGKQENCMVPTKDLKDKFLE